MIFPAGKVVDGGPGRHYQVLTMDGTAAGGARLTLCDHALDSCADVVPLPVKTDASKAG